MGPMEESLFLLNQTTQNGCQMGIKGRAGLFGGGAFLAEWGRQVGGLVLSMPAACRSWQCHTLTARPYFGVSCRRLQPSRFTANQIAGRSPLSPPYRQETTLPAASPRGGSSIKTIPTARSPQPTPMSSFCVRIVLGLQVWRVRLDWRGVRRPWK